MRDLLYFQPDPQIPDADMLGYGDLVYSDGTTEYLSGDPEMAMGLPSAPPGVQPQGSLNMGPPAPPQQQPQAAPPPMQVVDLGEGKQVQMDQTGNLRPMEGVQDPNTGELLDPGQPSNFLPGIAGEIGNAAQGYPQPLGQAWEGERGGGASPAAAPMGQPPAGGGGAPGAPQSQVIDLGGGKVVQMDQTGNLTPAQPGMLPVSRTGALPQDMAQRQLGDMQAQQQATLGATQQGRADEVRLYNELTLKQMAANEAERVKREQDLADQQSRVERWQQEQQAVLDQGIETDLVSAKGPIGAALAVIGAALLGGAGNDTGLRMIESSIDRHVRNQVQRRDTKLGILSQQIGSSMQAIALGKAALYKVAADKTQLLAEKTQNDVYEAKSPAIIETLKQKSLEQFQEAERLSIGKTLEKTPLPPKPPSAEMLQKYGELRRERAGNESMLQRVDQQLGLIWAPGQNGQPGHYANVEEVRKRGIQGVGELEQWIPDFVYSTAGKAAAEGYQIRGAKQALAYAVVRQMQPTGPITDVDRKVGEIAATLDTEDGMLSALSRLRVGEEQQKAFDVQQFGPDVVGEFDRRGGGAQAPAQPTPTRPATLEEKRGQASSLRGGGQPQAAAAGAQGDAMAVSAPERMAMISEDLQTLAGNELPPGGLAILVAQAAHETGDGARLPRNNFFGHKASGGRASVDLETTEGEGADEKRVRQKFATYNSSTESAADHISLLKRKYPRAWEALEVEDPDAFVAALKDGGYFTANEAKYRAAILRRL